MDNTENNRLIAEFMGYQENEDGFINDPSSATYVRGFYFPDGRTEAKYLRFDSSWDWLMPVVEKIESLVFPNDVFYNFNILGGCTVTVISSNMDIEFDVSEPTKLLSVYKAIIQFIKWYNQQK